MLKEYISDSADETFDIGKTFSGCLKCGDVIALSGDLGAGKTVFVKGIAKGLNIGELITSPTFNIVREYQGDLKLYHFDVYRLSDIDEFYAIGGEEYFEKGICLIEWGELIEDTLPKDYLHIVFSKDEKDENIRILNIYTNSNRWEDYFENIKH